MPNFDKLKKKAVEFETRNQPDRALEMYEEILNNTRVGEEGRDIPLYNRVGDLHFGAGNNEQAIEYYEKAADLYAHSGSLNNAIALCNKILRLSPDQTAIYYKLGIISARKGFNSDAKQNFLEYADRMQRQGERDEAFRALKEFADLCPEQDDVRLLLAEQLARAGRRSEALRQLQILHAALEAQGRSTEAVAALERMKAIDPEFSPQISAVPPQPKRDGHGFLDLGFGSSPSDAGVPASGHGAEAGPVAATNIPASNGIESEPRQEDAPELGSSDHDSDGIALEPSYDSVAAASNDGVDGEPVELLPLTEGFEAAREDEPEAATTDPVMAGDVIDRADEGVVLEKENAGDDAGASDTVETAVAESTEAVSSADDEYVDLGEWLERIRTPVSTRMVAHDDVPEDNAQKEFGEMLEKFKQGVSRNVDEEDFESHYDLGIAFREMGLLDEAIRSFQKAARGTGLRVRAAESMGECFLDKNEPGVAMAVLDQLGHDPTINDTQLVGVLYLLGRSAEALGRPSEASGFYHRVLAVHIGFRDTQDRLSSLTQASL